MKIKNIKISRVIFSLLLVCATVLSLFNISNVNAEDRWSFSVSPMKEKILLNPGEKYSSSITVYTPSNYDTDIKYSIEAAEYYVDEKNNNSFSDCGAYCEIKNWITIESPTEGILKPGEKATIKYTIDVPKDAPGGGQYASIMVQGDPWSEEIGNEQDSKDNEMTTTIKEKRKIAYVVYAEVAGDVTRQGEITDINLPSFLLSGNITGSASVKNTGNVHGDAEYKLQVFPLFSNEEIYTNEEDPDTKTILPDRTRYETTAWEGTPSMGIFNVIYTVEFAGQTAQISKMVIICPIWLLFIIFFVIAAIIIWLVMRARSRKSTNSRKASTE